MARFDLQGHRGARGLKPENTLPSFEAALDAGVCTIETDIHLTSDAVPVLFHDPAVNARTCRLLPKAAAPDPFERPLVRSLTLAQLRAYRADINADPARFPDQDSSVTPLAEAFARESEIDPYVIPTLAELFAFVTAYGGRLGRIVEKPEALRDRALDLRFDLELKRVPFHPETVDDKFEGDSPGLLEKRVIEEIRKARMADRCLVRSFDHRSVRAARKLEPRIRASVLMADTAPVGPARLARRADAQVYCPDYRFLDEALVRACREKGIRVVPWTVNEPDEWERLLAWDVDSITTDYPDRLAAFLRERQIAF